MFRNFYVEKIVQESATIKSFYLKRTDNKALDNYLPGQFVTIKIKENSNVNEQIRNYTISDSPGKGYFRLTIKREENGNVSKYFHDTLKIGDIVAVSKPSGNFYLQPNNSNTAFFLSGGVGITPMLCMLEYIAENEQAKKVFFLHSSLNKKVQPMLTRLKELKSKNSNLYLSVHHSNPSSEEKLKVDYDYEGVISKEYLQNILPETETDFFLCGPTPFMAAMYSYLLELGVNEKNINYEFFGDGKKFDSKKSIEEINLTDYKVHFTKSGIVTYWDSNSNSILDLAEANGLSPSFSCRMGTCSTCESKLKSGNIEYDPEPFMEAEEGNIFICCSKPTSNIEIEL
jgi:ferredoxin-NADP reductase